MGVRLYYCKQIEGLGAKTSSWLYGTIELYCSIKPGGRFCPKPFNYSIKQLIFQVLKCKVILKWLKSPESFLNSHLFPALVL